MSWLAAILLAASALGAVTWAKPARKAWQAVAAALMLGLAGYALQGRPDLQGRPKAPPAGESATGDPAAMVAARRAVTGSEVDSGNRWLMIADAMAARGHYADAATVLQGAVRDNPRDAQAWLALANALMGHAEGRLTPAALHAFRQAAKAAPDQPGPPFFLGLALASSGQYEQARGVWSRLLAATPRDAPWRPDLEQRLAQLDAFLRARAAAGQ